MIDKFFNCFELNNYFWLEYSDVNAYLLISQLDLFEILFVECNLDKIGVCIKNHFFDCDVVWLNQNMAMQDMHTKYGHYIQNMYNVTGIVFLTCNDRQDFIKNLSKKITWKLLQQ